MKRAPAAHAGTEQLGLLWYNIYAISEYYYGVSRQAFNCFLSTHLDQTIRPSQDD